MEYFIFYLMLFVLFSYYIEFNRCKYKFFNNIKAEGKPINIKGTIVRIEKISRDCIYLNIDGRKTSTSNLKALRLDDINSSIIFVKISDYEADAILIADNR